jgi:hypothetical protein
VRYLRFWGDLLPARDAMSGLACVTHNLLRQCAADPSAGFLPLHGCMFNTGSLLALRGRTRVRRACILDRSALTRIE